MLFKGFIIQATENMMMFWEIFWTLLDSRPFIFLFVQLNSFSIMVVDVKKVFILNILNKLFIISFIKAYI